MRGLRDPNKRNKIFNYLKKIKSDIIMLQETHVLKNDHELWKANWGRGDIYLNCFNNKSVGTVVLLNRKENVVSPKIVSQGRCHTLEIKRGDITVELMNIYAQIKTVNRFYSIVKYKIIFNIEIKRTI